VLRRFARAILKDSERVSAGADFEHLVVVLD
jgi:hypothetical protein